MGVVPAVESTTPAPTLRPAGAERDRVSRSDRLLAVNPIEHRLCSHMSLNWAGQPLRTLETRLSYWRGTTTATGLRVTASRIEDVYETGQRVADAVMKTLQVEHDVVCPQWN